MIKNTSYKLQKIDVDNRNGDELTKFFLKRQELVKIITSDAESNSKYCKGN